MKVVSIINYKGGVGKTTLTANLAAGMAIKGKRVLVIDLDPQTNLTFSFISVEDWDKNLQKNKTIKYWFDSILDDVKPAPTFQSLIITKSGIDIICSHLGLIDVDIELAVGLSAGTERQHKMNYIKTYSYIKRELGKINEAYDVVLFDCPPNFSIVTKNAIIASDYYIVPAKMDYLSTLGINQLRRHVERLVKNYNGYIDNEAEKVNPAFLGVIATMIQIRSGVPISAQQSYINELARSNITLFSSMIRENKTIYSSAPEYGIPVVLHMYNPGTTYDNVVTELENLTNEFIRKVGI